MTIFRTATAADWSAIELLLAAAGLPLDGARDHVAHFEIAEDDASVIGCAAIEPYEGVALLRSVAVDSSKRGGGVGEALVSRVIDRAQRAGVDSLWLLTTTAAGWFPRFGFTEASRVDVPHPLQASKEFQGACPASATVMQLKIR